MILFNKLTNAILHVEPPKVEKVLSILNSKAIPDSEDEDIKMLKRGGYIIEDDFDEIDYLRVRFNMYKFNNRFLRFTIALTPLCNFSCTYCYQNQVFPIMRRNMPPSFHEDMIDNLLKAIEKMMMYQKPQLLSITFYGGEPLLELDTMIKLSDAFKKMCETHGAEYRPFMVTNGYTLTPGVADRLINAGMKSAIVTLDGDAEYHDKYRKLKNGEVTFSRIFENIKNIWNKMHIQIRTNVCKDNVESVKRMIKLFADEDIHVSFDFQMIEVSSELPSKFDGTPLTLKEFARTEVELYREVLEHFPDYDFNPFRRIRFARCDVLCSTSFVVEPDGKLYKCWGEVGISTAHVGHIKKGGNIEFNHRLERWLAWSPFESERCRGCDILPLCMGGCVFNAILVDKLHVFPVAKPYSCLPLKYNLKEMVELVAENKLRKAQKRRQCSEIKS